MIAAEGHARNDHLRFAGGHDLPGRHPVADDLVVDLDIEITLVHADAGATRAARLHRRPKALHDVRLARAGGVLQRHHETARGRLVVAVVNPAPRVDVHDTIRSHDHVSRMSELVGKDGRAESVDELQPAVIARAGLLLFGELLLSDGRRGGKGRQHHQGGKECSLRPSGHTHEASPRTTWGPKSLTTPSRAARRARRVTAR